MENPFFLGYIHLPEMTKEALRGGLFNSGDPARKDEYGNLILPGRADDMIKTYGNRVEPGEIKRAFQLAAKADWVYAKGFEAGAKSLICLYYTGDLPVGEDEITTALKKMER